MNQNEIPVDLSCYRTHLALIMSLTGMKILTNMVYNTIQDNAILESPLIISLTNMKIFFTNMAHLQYPPK